MQNNLIFLCPSFEKVYIFGKIIIVVNMLWGLTTFGHYAKYFTTIFAPIICTTDQ